MSLTDFTNTAFTSTKPADKIVGVYEGSFDTTSGVVPLIGGYIGYTSFAHTFTRPVFTKLQTSFDQVNWRDENSNQAYSISYSTSTEIFVLHAPDNGTVYYRVIAFWIDDYDSTNPSVAPTVGSQSNIYFDSRLNYQKIAFQDEVTIPAATITQTDTITHNLGYKPNVRVYVESYPGEVWPATYGGITGNYWDYSFSMVQSEVKVYDNTVDILSGGGLSAPEARMWYRIYYDG